jgi:hypothetical protein
MEALRPFARSSTRAAKSLGPFLCRRSNDRDRRQLNETISSALSGHATGLHAASDLLRITTLVRDTTEQAWADAEAKVATMAAGVGAAGAADVRDRPLPRQVVCLTRAELAELVSWLLSGWSSLANPATESLLSATASRTAVFWGRSDRGARGASSRTLNLVGYA